MAQHYRDIRIAPIYEGTNGIQAIDLVGRKLGLRGGAAITEYLDRIAATADEASAAGGALAPCGAALSAALDALRPTTQWLRDAADPNDPLAGATPYLRMMGIVTGGWLLTEAALAADERGDRLLGRVPGPEGGHGPLLRHPDPAPGRRPGPGGDGGRRRPVRFCPLKPADRAGSE